MPRPAKPARPAALPVPGLSFGLFWLVAVGLMLIFDRLV